MKTEEGDEISSFWQMIWKKKTPKATSTNWNGPAQVLVQKQIVSTVQSQYKSKY